MALQAGASEVSIDRIGRERCARRGLPLAPAEWEPQMRCLVLSCDEQWAVVFNADWGTWPKLFEEARQVVESKLADQPVEVFCCATHANHNLDFAGIDWGALNPKQSDRFDAVMYRQILDAVEEVFLTAYQCLRPAILSAGQGVCSAVSVNSFWGEGRTDPSVHVLRIADLDNALLAAVVNFGCRSDDSTGRHVSGGFAGAMECVVQKIYGPVPVLYFDSAGGDLYSAVVRNPINWAAGDKAKYMETQNHLLSREFNRIGRMLGGEVCKVLAELEVAGETLEADNQRWRYSSWLTQAEGIRIVEPTLRTVTLSCRLWHKPLPSVEGCEQRIKDLHKEIMPLQKRLPYEPREAAPYGIASEDKDSDLYRWMELCGVQKYWKNAVGRAKWVRRYHKEKERTGQVKILALGPELAIVALPAALCEVTTSTLRQRSPFPTTQVWGHLAPSNWNILIPEAESTLGGTHAGWCDYAQDAIDQMVDEVVNVLREIHALIGLNAGSSGTTRK